MRIFIVLLILSLLAGCVPSITVSMPERASAPQSVPAPPSQSIPASFPPPEHALPEQTQPTEAPAQNRDGIEYIRGVARTIAKELKRPDMNDYQLAQAAFEYLIANTAFADPVGLDIWRIRGGGELPSFLENRGVIPLLFGIGSCEDYAAALVLLLEEMGIEARYVPGLTYSVQGEFVDHAWTVAKIGGKWYHLDSQLEDNIMRDNMLRYRYFMRGDEAMQASHRWGENLVGYRLLTQAQNDEISEKFLIEACLESYPTPSPKYLQNMPVPDITAIIAEIETEKQSFELTNGHLEPLEMNILPPVFGQSTYPPQY